MSEELHNKFTDLNSENNLPFNDYQSVFNLASNSLAITNYETGRIIDVNDTWIKSTGISRENSIGKTALELGIWAFTEERTQCIELLKKNGQITDFSASLKLVDGIQNHLINSKSLIWNNKKVLLWDFRNIHEYISLNNSLTNAKEYLNAVFDNSHLPIIIMDPKTHRFIDCNEAGVRIYQFGSKSEVLGKSVKDVSAPKQYNNTPSEELASTYIEKALNDGSVVFEWLHQRPNGELWDAEVYLLSFYINNDKYLQFSLVDITGRKKAEKDLILKNQEYEVLNEELIQTNDSLYAAKLIAEEKENQVQLIANNFVKGMLYQVATLNNTERKFTFLSQAVERLYGCTFEQASKDPNLIYSRIHPDDIEMLIDKEVKAIKTLSLFECEARVFNVDNSIRWSYFISKPRIIKGVIYWDGIEIDITEYKKLELDLIKANELATESEQHFRSIIENSHAGYFFIDLDGLFQQVNQAWLRLYKFDSPDEVIGKHFVEVQQIDDIEAAKIFVAGIQKNDPIFTSGEFSRKCKDGSIGYHTFSARPVHKNKKLIGIEGFIIDITPQKLFEKELIKAKEIAEQNEKKFHSLFNALQEGVYLHDIIYDENGKYINYRIIEANPISEKYLNIKPDFAIGKLATELYGTEEPPFLEEFCSVSETGEAKLLEQYFEPMKKHFLVSVFSPNKGQFATVFLDITKIKNYEKELILAKEKAEESDRLKTAFLQNMSHEIRTPMNAIMGFAELLPDTINEPDKLIKYSEIISQRCNDLLDIINDILDIAKIESGQLTINSEHFNISELFLELKEFFKEHQKKLNKEQIKFNFKISDQLHNLNISTDKVKLKQVFINLISNAFKFTENGLIEGGCKNDENNNIVFYVSDTGIGIAPEKHKFIFERFTQLGNNSRLHTGGTGLGLSIVKGLVNLLGGTIWLESEPHKGTTFFFTLKLQNIVLPKLNSSSIEVYNNENLSNLQILVVEDDFFNIALIKEILSKHVSNLHFVSSGYDTIAFVKNNNPDIILLDIGLPDTNGYVLVPELLKINPKLKIIAQTAYAASDDRIKSIKAGCIDYISKPLKSQKLIEIILQNI